MINKSLRCQNLYVLKIIEQNKEHIIKILWKFFNNKKYIIKILLAKSLEHVYWWNYTLGS